MEESQKTPQPRRAGPNAAKSLRWDRLTFDWRRFDHDKESVSN